MAEEQFEFYKKLKILLLEDSEEDVGLIERVLKKSDFIPEIKVADDKKTFVYALAEFEPDIILADYTLPSFSGLEALQLAVKLDSPIPFVFVSGTIGEEIAAETILNGASGFVLKSNINKLPELIAKVMHEKPRWLSPRLKRASARIEKRLETNVKTLDRISKYLEGAHTIEVFGVKKDLTEVIKELKNLKLDSK